MTGGLRTHMTDVLLLRGVRRAPMRPATLKVGARNQVTKVSSTGLLVAWAALCALRTVATVGASDGTARFGRALIRKDPQPAPDASSAASRHRCRSAVTFGL